MEESVKDNMYGQYVVPSAEKMVNLGVGQPRNECLSKVVSKTSKILSKMGETKYPGEVLQYGDIPGYYRFRKELSKYLNTKNYDKSLPDDFFQTNGATEAITLLATTLFDSKRDIIVVENPTYFLMINIFKELGFKIKSVNLEDDGVNIRELRDILEENRSKRVLFYSIPFNHNPTGITTSISKQFILKALLKEFDNFYMATDEVYQLLDFEEIYHEPWADFHPKMITVGSFSKVIAPAFRIGWIYSKNKEIMNSLKKSAARDSSGGNNVINSLIVEEILKSGEINELLKDEKERLRDNMCYIRDFMDTNLKKYFKFDYPKGGYFLWLRLRKEYKYLKNAIFEKMEEFGVKFHCGNKFSANKKDFDDCLRLSLSFYTKEEIMLGVYRLFKLMNYLENNFKCKIGILGHKGRLGSLIFEKFKNKTCYLVEGYDNSKIIEYDFIIDVSSISGTIELLETLLIKDYDKYPTIIIGTTGHKDFILMEEYSKKGNIYYASNFSQGIQMVKECLNKIKKHNLDRYVLSMEETHHIHKLDAPSGTAKTLGKILNLDDEKILSKREGEVIGEHIIKLESDDEVIEIKHYAKNRELFANGCINLIDDLYKKPKRKNDIVYL